MRTPSHAPLAVALAAGLALGAGCASRGDIDQAKQEAKTSTQKMQREVQTVQERTAATQRTLLTSSADNRRRAETMVRDSAALRASAEKTAKAIEALQPAAAR